MEDNKETLLLVGENDPVLEVEVGYEMQGVLVENKTSSIIQTT